MAASNGLTIPLGQVRAGGRGGRYQPKRVHPRTAPSKAKGAHSQYSGGGEPQAVGKAGATAQCDLTRMNFFEAAETRRSVWKYTTCPMEGFDEVRVKKILGLAQAATVVMVISVGKEDPAGIYGERLRLDPKLFGFEV